MLFNGPSCGHDFDFHLLSWFEASTQFAHLHYPLWAYTPAFNAGEPRFVFYPPLSWALGALLGLLLPWKLVPAAFTFLALTLSGFSMRRLALNFASPNTAVMAAVLYVVNPYMLLTAYERTAYGELLAAAWIPLLLLAALAPRVRIVPLAIPIALLWLTNVPAAIMSCYALALLVVCRLVLAGRAPKQGCSRRHLALATGAGTVLGLALPAFYLVPAVAERGYIQANMAIIEGMRIADNTLFHHMSPATEDNLAHDAVLHTASVISVTLLLTIAALILLTAFSMRRLDQPHRSRWAAAAYPLTMLAMVIAVLLTPVSLRLWTYAPELRFLQFPWRLDAILAAILCLFATFFLERFALKSLAVALTPMTFAAAFVYPAWHLLHQRCDDEDTVHARVALYHSNRGTDPTDEYTPASADNEALAQSNPPYWIVPIYKPFGQPNPYPAPCDEAAPPDSAPGQAPGHLVVDAPVPELLVLNRRNFPSWTIRVNGALASSCDRDDGLICVALPPGHDTIDLSYRLPYDQRSGLALSFLSLVAAVWIQFKSRRRPNLFG